MFALYNVGRALKLTGNMKKYNFNNTTYTEKELVKIAREKGKESKTYKYSNSLLDKQGKLKDYEFIFNLSFNIDNVEVHCFFFIYDRTDKETFINEITFTIN